MDEILSDTQEAEVAFRGGFRKVRRLIKVPTPTATAEQSRQLKIARRGTIDGLEFVSAPLQQVGPYEIQMEVAAAGLNFRDVLNVMGLYPGSPPLGAECVGTVRRVGSEVRKHRVGDRVAAIAADAFRDNLIVHEDAAVKIPQSLSFPEAATIPIAFLTANHALVDVAKLQPGQRVLIHSAAGGVGLAAVQIAKQTGAEIHATASLSKHGYLRETLGLQFTSDSRSSGFGEQIRKRTSGQGVDVVLNTLGEEFLAENLLTLCEGGIYVDLSLSTESIQTRIAADARMSATWL